MNEMIIPCAHCGAGTMYVGWSIDKRLPDTERITISCGKCGAMISGDTAAEESTPAQLRELIADRWNRRDKNTAPDNDSGLRRCAHCGAGTMFVGWSIDKRLPDTERITISCGKCGAMISGDTAAEKCTPAQLRELIADRWNRRDKNTAPDNDSGLRRCAHCGAPKMYARVTECKWLHNYRRVIECSMCGAMVTADIRETSSGTMTEMQDLLTAKWNARSDNRGCENG